jgi:transcriptional regulator with XRE-family HTH domain
VERLRRTRPLFRERADLTRQALADAIGYSIEQVASVEQGRRPAKAAFTDAAERVPAAGGALRALQEDVDRAQLPASFQDVAALEQDAASRFSYDPLLVPGLLQTEGYAQELLSSHFPSLDAEVVEQRVLGRLAGQTLLTRRGPAIVFVFIVEESALRRVVGSKEVMREQLGKLLECSKLRNVELQVMPTARGARSGLNGPVVLLETRDHRQYVYIEAQDVVSVMACCARRPSAPRSPHVSSSAWQGSYDHRPI